MANIKMLNMAGAEVGEITLNDAIFGIELTSMLYTLPLKTIWQTRDRELNLPRQEAK